MLSRKIKKWVFWTHLSVGLGAGVLIFMMAFTGVLLTYERQIKELDEMRYTVEYDSAQTYITTDKIVDILQRKHPDEPHIYVRWVNREGAAVPAWAGPHSYLLHPYTGEVLREGQGSISEIFHVITDLHRYLLLEGENREIGKTINGYANLVFIFLILSGLYLWLPGRFSLRSLRQQALLPKRYTNRFHRRRQWHLVFGFWSLPALFVIAITATLFHFDWANRALYGYFGESVPTREEHDAITNLDSDIVDYQTLFTLARQHARENNYQDWYSMWMEIGEHQHEARFYIDKSIGHRQELAYSLYFDTRNGGITQVQRKSDWSEGDQAWGTSRFLHTGEYFGVVGQTIAGLVSLLACVLVYTGFLLAWKRLVNPVRR